MAYEGNSHWPESTTAPNDIIENFVAHGARGYLVKAAYTGITASLIGGKHCMSLSAPVATHRSAALFWPCDTARDTTDEQLGGKIYEKFTVVV